jgi:protein TonB
MNAPHPAAALASERANARTRCISGGRWFASFALVASAHAGVWYGATHAWPQDSAFTPLPVVQVSLVARPPQPHVTPLRAAPKRTRIAPPEPQTETPPPAPSTHAADKPASEPPAPQPVAAEALALEPETYVQPVFSASYLNNPPPAYPLAARRRGQAGTVIVRAEIGSDGGCRQAALKQGSGHPLLDRAAVDAVRKWRFVPAKRGDTAVAAWVEVPITFKLEDS